MKNRIRFAIVVFVLGLGSMALAHPAPVQAADPNWEYIRVGVSNSASDSFIVSDDGTYCKYPTDFPIKANANVKLTTEPDDEPVVASLNSLIAEIYNEGEKGPGDGCVIWARFDSVPMNTPYVIQISADATDDATNSATYTGDMVVVLSFWTLEFETSIGPDGGPVCAPTASTAMRPGGSFQSEPKGEPLNDPAITGEVNGDGCRVMLAFLVPPSDEITVAIGDAQLDSNESLT